MIGSLTVGKSFAKALSYVTKKPLVYVNHIKAHIVANFLCEEGEKSAKPTLPAIGLVVSGGHTALYCLRSHRDFEMLGQTRDDAAGESFDKVAKILDLGYPGGPAIEKAAKVVTESDIIFNCGKLANSYDFSFSGVKTAVLYYHRKNGLNEGYNKNEVAFAFQRSVVKNLIQKCLFACKDRGVNTLLIGGGVAANLEFRRQLDQKAKENNINYFFPKMSFCTDNAAMIAGLGYYEYKKEV